MGAWGSGQGLCPRTPRIYRLMPLPMLGLLWMHEKGDGGAFPLFESVEATESALRLLPSIALSSAQSGLILLGRGIQRRFWWWVLKV